jgi:hypothetical protein
MKCLYSGTSNLKNDQLVVPLRRRKQGYAQHAPRRFAAFT